MELKQVILVREDLKLSKGKLAVQVAHGSCEALLRSNKNLVKKWREGGQKKVCLKVKDKGEIFKFDDDASSYGLTTAIIKDAGRTEIAPNTITVLAIGPDFENKIDKITKNLKIL